MVIFKKYLPSNKSVYGWAIYDWANSAFATTVMAVFFPLFFKRYWSAGIDANLSTAQLGLGNSLASLTVAILAPVAGAVADKGSTRKKFLVFFAYLGALMTGALFFVHQGSWEWAIFIYVLGVVGFSGANVFYDALLPHVAKKEEVDYISGLGYGLGYLGGGLLLLLNVLMVLMPTAFGLTNGVVAVRVAFLSVAAWWGLFTIFTIVWVKESPVSVSNTLRAKVVLAGFRQFMNTFKKIRHLKAVFIFLIAYWFYIDGVHTIIRMAMDYGLSLGFNDNDLIVAFLIVQFVGFPASIIYVKFAQQWSVRKALFLGIFIYMAITVWGMQLSSSREFYGLAIVVGLVQGGIQALSRSYYTRLIPVSQSGEYFGFYNMIGKFAAILGPVLIGSFGLIIKYFLVSEGMTPAELQQASQVASRWSISAVLLLLLSGAILFYFVDEVQGKREQEYLEKISD